MKSFDSLYSYFSNREKSDTILPSNIYNRKDLYCKKNENIYYPETKFNKIENMRLDLSRHLFKNESFDHWKESSIAFIDKFAKANNRFRQLYLSETYAVVKNYETKKEYLVLKIIITFDRDDLETYNREFKKIFNDLFGIQGAYLFPKSRVYRPLKYDKKSYKVIIEDKKNFSEEEIMEYSDIKWIYNMRNNRNQYDSLKEVLSKTWTSCDDLMFISNYSFDLIVPLGITPIVENCSESFNLKILNSFLLPAVEE